MWIFRRKKSFTEKKDTNVENGKNSWAEEKHKCGNRELKEFTGNNTKKIERKIKNIKI